MKKTSEKKLTASQQNRILADVMYKFGVHGQIDKAIEDVDELHTALLEFKHGISNSESVIDEIADVRIMVTQLSHIFGTVDVSERIDFKLRRLDERLKNGYYDGQ